MFFEDVDDVQLELMELGRVHLSVLFGLLVVLATVRSVSTKDIDNIVDAFGEIESMVAHVVRAEPAARKVLNCLFRDLLDTRNPGRRQLTDLKLSRVFKMLIEVKKGCGDLHYCHSFKWVGSYDGEVKLLLSVTTQIESESQR